ncbi:MAG: 2-succinyl-6-hydroxy-2,4-cyclohexadiene-1-carboxylate synthase [Aeromonadaceae bacterium]
MSNRSLPHLIFLHGFLGQADEWQPLLALLPEALRGRCHCLELPGHGKNRQTVRDLQECNLWLTQELEARGVTHMVLYGYSLGSRLALHYAATSAQTLPSPPTLCGLIMESGHPGLTAPEARQQRASQDALWARRLRREPLPSWLAAWYQQPVFAELDAQTRAELIALRSRNSGPQLARMLTATSLARQPDLRPWLRQTQLPLLYLSGERDPKFAQLACQLSQECATLSHLSLPQAGHNIHHAQPQALAAALQAWLAEQGWS